MDSGLLKGLFDFFDVVGTEVIHDDNVVFPECRNQIVLQIIYELLSRSPSAVGGVNRSPFQAYGRQDRRAFRSVQRHASDNAFSALRSSVSAGHIRVDSAFIQKVQMLDVKCLYQSFPLAALFLHIGDAPVRRRAWISSCGGIPFH